MSRELRQAGRMRQRIRIQAKTTTIDDLGEPVEAWADLAQAWAEKLALRQREFVAAGGEQQEVTVVYRIRWRIDVTVQMRVMDGATAYNIRQAIDESGQRRTLTLRCTETA